MPLRFVFLTLHSYSLIPLSSAIETLRLANRASGQDAYSWTLATPDGQAAMASNGMRLHPTVAIRDIEAADFVFVCGGVGIEQSVTAEVLRAIHALQRKTQALGSLCTGIYALAKAGLLDGYRAAAHWEYKAQLQAYFPLVEFSSQVFAVDRDRYTCSGGISTLDMMLSIIHAHQGQEITMRVSEQLILGRIRDSEDHQHVPLLARMGRSDEALHEAAALMEANIEEPLSLDEVARLAGITRRQLERLFQRHMHESPGNYYLELRLRRARSLILETSLTIVDVGQACGFQSAPYFSKRYRSQFGCAPSDERRNAIEAHKKAPTGLAWRGQRLQAPPSQEIASSG